MQAETADSQKLRNKVLRRIAICECHGRCIVDTWFRSKRAQQAIRFLSLLRHKRERSHWPGYEPRAYTHARKCPSMYVREYIQKRQDGRALFVGVPTKILAETQRTLVPVLNERSSGEEQHVAGQRNNCHLR